MADPMTAARTFLQQTGSIVWMCIHTVGEMGDALARTCWPFRPTIFFQQMDRAGVGSVPLVTLVSLFLGLTMALLTGYQLRPYGQEDLVPPLVAVAFTRELGPLLTGIMVASRIGAAFTAELGTMTVSQEVEALETMGIGPLRFLVGPRALAVTLLMPSLVVVSNCAALGGAAVISWWGFDINVRAFTQSALDQLLVRDLVAGALKSVVFGVIIGLISCYKGLAVRGGAAAVGDATTSSVVSAVTCVIGFDTLFNVVLVALFD